MKPRHKKLIAISAGVSLLVVAGLLVLNAFRSNIVFFVSPTEVKEGKASTQGVFRLGGLVDHGSVRRTPDSLRVEFQLTDLAQCMLVRYDGILPDLFRDGQGVIAEGRLQKDGSFLATTVLAKHDEKYMPPEVAQSLKGTASSTPVCKKTTL
jgi:cytochrome c-type biogenesis protein CcmE